MQETGIVLGGEQSGHIIMSDLGTTGDGILTAIILTEEIIDTEMRMSELSKGLIKYPQKSESVRVKNKDIAMRDSDIESLINRFQSGREEGYRIIVRASGTEPKIRIMTEAPTQNECNEISKSIISILERKEYLDE